jgi:hypothetical protein
MPPGVALGRDALRALKNLSHIGGSGGGQNPEKQSGHEEHNGYTSLSPIYSSAADTLRQ